MLYNTNSYPTTIGAIEILSATQTEQGSTLRKNCTSVKNFLMVKIVIETLLFELGLGVTTICHEIDRPSYSREEHKKLQRGPLE